MPGGLPHPVDMRLPACSGSVILLGKQPRWQPCWRGSCAPRAHGRLCCDARYLRCLSAGSKAVASAEMPVAVVPSMSQGTAACSHPLAAGGADAGDGGAADGAQACGSAREDRTATAACAWDDGSGDDGGFGGDDDGWDDGGGARIRPGGGRRATRASPCLLAVCVTRRRGSSSAALQSRGRQGRRLSAQCSRRCRPVPHMQRLALCISWLTLHLQSGGLLPLANPREVRAGDAPHAHDPGRAASGGAGQSAPVTGPGPPPAPGPAFHDPYAPLDPHAAGGLPLRPFRKGRPPRPRAPRAAPARDAAGGALPPATDALAFPEFECAPEPAPLRRQAHGGGPAHPQPCFAAESGTASRWRNRLTTHLRCFPTRSVSSWALQVRAVRMRGCGAQYIAVDAGA